MLSGKLTCLVGVFALLFVSSTALAEKAAPTAMASTAKYRGKALVQATLLVDVVKAAPGTTFYAGVLFKMAPGWHIYWRNPGDAGLPTRLNWSSSGKGVTIGEPAWPAPMVKRDAAGQITTYEYGGQTLITVPVISKVRRGRPDISLAVKVKLLACKKVCIAGDLTLSRRVPVAEAVQPLTRAERWTFERFQRHVPKAAGNLGYSQRWTVLPLDTSDKDRLRLQVELSCKGASPCLKIQVPSRENQRDTFMLQSGKMESVKVERIQATNGGRTIIIILSAMVEPEQKKMDLPLRGVLSVSNQRGQPMLLELGGIARRVKDGTDI